MSLTRTYFVIARSVVRHRRMAISFRERRPLPRRDCRAALAMTVWGKLPRCARNDSLGKVGTREAGVMVWAPAFGDRQKQDGQDLKDYQDWGRATAEIASIRSIPPNPAAAFRLPARVGANNYSPLRRDYCRAKGGAARQADFGKRTTSLKLIIDIAIRQWYFLPGISRGLFRSRVPTLSSRGAQSATGGWRSRSGSDVRYRDEIAALRSQ